MKSDTNALESALDRLIREILTQIGENPQREGLMSTPQRAAEAWRSLLQGYGQNAETILTGGLFPTPHDGIVVLKDIDFCSICEHHLLPFFGKCHIAYLPGEQIVGLSKLARVVEVYSKRLQVQERMTKEIAESIDRYVKPRAVAVVIEAQHLCMIARGVQKQNSIALTCSVLGEFQANLKTQQDFLELFGIAKRG